MGKRLLIPLDGSEQAWEAFEFALGEFPDDELVLLNVINPAVAGYNAQASIPSFSEEWYEQAQSDAEDLFADASEQATDHDVAISTDIVVGKPSRAIAEYADDHDVDQIVMGSHGRSGVSRVLLGSVAENVVRSSTVPVTVAR